MYAGNRVFHFPPLFLSFLSRTRPFFLFERARVLSFFPALKARLLRKRKKEFVPPSDHGDSHSLPVIPVCQRVPPRYKCWDEAKGPPFLLAVWKNASTNMNHGIFVQLFCDLLDIYCIFMLYAYAGGRNLSQPWATSVQMSEGGRKVAQNVKLRWY